ncbi:MAG: hypothetical protein WA767_02130, partial [Pseudolabrys sp.]
PRHTRSDLPSEADIRGYGRNVRQVPEADIALHYSITASAVLNSDGEIVRLSTLAVFRSQWACALRDFVHQSREVI